MAVIEMDRQFQGPFRAVWEHYLASRFIYPAKLERLQPALGLIRSGWPLLLEAPADVFQFHLARKEGAIASSISAFRDTAETYVMQHAASAGHPIGMLNCLRSCLATINADPGFSFGRMYFRPENRWPVRAQQAVAAVMPPGLCEQTTQNYLICQPQSVHADLPDVKHVVDVPESAAGQVRLLALAAMGPLRAAALGLGDLSLAALNTRYLASGLRRTRRVLGYYRENALAGVALCFSCSVPANFSFLCSRVELLIHPDAGDRGTVVRALARASIREAAVRGDPVCAALVDPTDQADAIAGGYAATNKQYASFLWSRENVFGAPSAVAGIERLYRTADRLRAAARAEPTRVRAGAQLDD